MDEEIQKIVEKNLKLTEDIYAMTKKIRSYLAFQRLVSIFYLIMIVAPIILSIFFLPALLNNFVDQYKSILDIDSENKTDLINNLLKK